MTFSHFSENELTYLGIPRDLTYYVMQRGAEEADVTARAEQAETLC